MAEKKFPEGFLWGEAGVGPRRKAGARRREAGSRNFSVEKYA